MAAALAVGVVITLVPVTVAAAARRVIQVLAVMADTQVAITQPMVLAVAVAAVV
jgi:hypothetical protein